MSTANEPRYVFTLVHGTYARMPWQVKTAWIQPDAWFATQLRKRLGEGVQVIPFEWGGWNNHTSRKRAARRLVDQLLTGTNEQPGTFKAFPRAQHYLVCHSHGGNVAMMALKNSQVQHGIAGVVSLATPFLVARKRVLGERTSEHVGVLIFVLLMIGLGLSQTFTFWNEWSGMTRALARFGGALFFTMAMMSLLLASSNFATDLEKAMAAPQNLKERKLLIIRAPGDEASAALGFFQFISLLSVRVFLLFTLLNARLERWTDRWPTKRSLLALIALAGFAGFMIADLISLVLWDTFKLIWVLAPSIAVGAASFLICLEAAGRFLSSSSPSKPIRLGTFVFRVLSGAVLLPVLLLLSVLLVPFGAKFALASLFLDVTAETTPMGKWTVHQIAPQATRDADVPLSHSGVYTNRIVVKKIAKWIGKREAVKV